MLWKLQALNGMSQEIPTGKMGGEKRASSSLVHLLLKM